MALFTATINLSHMHKLFTYGTSIFPFSKAVEA